MWRLVAHLKLIKLYICQRHAGDMHRVMVLVQSTQHNFPFKAHFSNHLIHQGFIPALMDLCLTEIKTQS